MARKILIVDDEEDVLKVASYRIRKMGFDVIQAMDGQQCLDMLKKDKPDLILLDLRLPVIDGGEVCKNIKADEDLKKIPVIIFTASTDKLEDKTIKMGADAYLTKPFDPEKMRLKINELLGIENG